MLTLFSAPKPFNGHIGIIQRNAIRSWTLLQPSPEVILFGNEEGIAEAAQDLGVRHIADIARNEYGTPLLNDLFEQAQSLAGQDLLCYVNADIILMSDFMAAVKQLGKLRQKLLGVGRRWDMDISDPLDFSSGWETALQADLAQRGQLHAETGIDYFLFSKGLWPTIPPFAIGRTAWDNWLICEARRLRAKVIDASRVVKIVHQNHDYLHVKDGIQGAWEGPEARRNQALANGGICTTEDAAWLLTSSGLVPALSVSHLKRRFIVWRAHHPDVWKFTKRIMTLGMRR